MQVGQQFVIRQDDKRLKHSETAIEIHFSGPYYDTQEI